MKNQSTEASKIHLLLAFGGQSAEHEVSVASAHYVYGLLNKERYDVTLSYVDRQGCWWKVDTIEDAPKQLNNELRPSLGRGEFIDSQGERLKPTVILPIMLGPNGDTSRRLRYLRFGDMHGQRRHETAAPASTCTSC
jgi:D-alanine-D-alanine ligase